MGNRIEDKEGIDRTKYFEEALSAMWLNAVDTQKLIEHLG